jgi:hypothetical protein
MGDRTMCESEQIDNVIKPESDITEEPVAPEPQVIPDAQPDLPEPQVAVEEFEAMAARVAELEGNVTELQRDSYKDQIIGKMQARVAELEPFESTVKQFRRSIMLLFDLAERIETEYREAARAGEQQSLEQVLLDLEVLRADIDTQIFTAGLTMYRASAEELEKGPALDIHRQRAVRAVPAAIPEDNLVVVESIRAGFQDENDRVVRKEDVAVKKFSAASN